MTGESGWACAVRLGGLGDLLIASSVFPLLRAKYGRLEVIAQAPHAEIIRYDPHIDKLTIKDNGDLPQHDGKAWQAWFRDRASEVDFLVNLSHSIETTLAFTEDQTQFWWPEAFRRKLCDVGYLARTHDICGVPHHYNPRFYPTDVERERALHTKRQMGDVVVGWCISGTRIDKVHPLSGLAVARIIKELGVPVVMFGAPGKDMAYTNQIFEHVKAANGSVDGLYSAITRDDDKAKADWPARRGLAQVRTCDVVVAPDTGLAWAVAMEPMPKVILHSHASVRNIVEGWTNTHSLLPDADEAPCWPCNRLHSGIYTCRPHSSEKGAACISSISVEDIVSTVAGLLPT